MAFASVNRQRSVSPPQDPAQRSRRSSDVMPSLTVTMVRIADSWAGGPSGGRAHGQGPASGTVTDSTESMSRRSVGGSLVLLASPARSTSVTVDNAGVLSVKGPPVVNDSLAEWSSLVSAQNHASVGETQVALAQRNSGPSVRSTMLITHRFRQLRWDCVLGKAAPPPEQIDVADPVNQHLHNHPRQLSAVTLGA